MKVITRNSVYVVDMRAKTVTGGILGDNKVPFSHVVNVQRGEQMRFINSKGAVVLKTSPVQDVTASLFDDVLQFQSV